MMMQRGRCQAQQPISFGRNNPFHSGATTHISFWRALHTPRQCIMRTCSYVHVAVYARACACVHVC